MPPDMEEAARRVPPAFRLPESPARPYSAPAGRAREDRVASPNELKVLSTTAMKMVFEELAPAFEGGSGYRLAVNLGP